MPSLAQSAIAEFIGTFIFITSIFVSSKTFSDTYSAFVPFAVAFGLLTSLFIAAPISGGHLNPAITVAAMFNDHTHIGKYCIYIAMQLIAACCVVGFVWWYTHVTPAPAPAPVV